MDSFSTTDPPPPHDYGEEFREENPFPGINLNGMNTNGVQYKITKTMTITSTITPSSSSASTSEETHAADNAETIESLKYELNREREANIRLSQSNKLVIDDNSGLCEYIDFLSTKLATTEKKLSTITQTATDQEEVINDLLKQCSERKTEIEKLKREKLDRETEVELLKQSLQEKDNAFQAFTEGYGRKWVKADKPPDTSDYNQIDQSANYKNQMASELGYPAAQTSAKNIYSEMDTLMKNFHKGTQQNNVAFRRHQEFDEEDTNYAKKPRTSAFTAPAPKVYLENVYTNSYASSSVPSSVGYTEDLNCYENDAMSANQNLNSEEQAILEKEYDNRNNATQWENYDLEKEKRMDQNTQSELRRPIIVLNPAKNIYSEMQKNLSVLQQEYQQKNGAIFKQLELDQNTQNNERSQKSTFTALAPDVDIQDPYNKSCESPQGSSTFMHYDDPGCYGNDAMSANQNWNMPDQSIVKIEPEDDGGNTTEWENY